MLLGGSKEGVWKLLKFKTTHKFDNTFEDLVINIDCAYVAYYRLMFPGDKANIFGTNESNRIYK